MNSRRMTFLVLLLFMILMSQVASGGVITKGLEKQLGSLKNQEMTTILVTLSDRVDVSSLDKQLHDQKTTRGARHEIVVSQLQEKARTSQKSLLAYLEDLKSQGLVASYTPHWLINAVVVHCSSETVLEISKRDDVGQIEANLIITSVEELAAEKTGEKSIGITPGVVSIGASRIWHEFGIDGTGTVVGNIDSGVDGSHPALVERWRGNFAPASECWLDAGETGHPDFPVDLREHGTHTMGTITGLAVDDSIGVAPGALWIAANPTASELGQFTNAVLASLEFMTDPDGDPSTMEDVPVAVNNSWGVHEGFAGFYDCDSRWWDAIDNCEAAGVVLVWAAGNEGPDAGSLRSPADRAASPYNCFSIGATTHSAPFEVADFSSRGPSGCGGPYAIKPEITAPGMNVYSSVPGGYDVFSGTSMAAPHVTGVVALMAQANPDLDVTSIKQILMETAIDLGTPGEDNDSGHGFIDAYTAVLRAMEDAGTVTVTVLDSQTGTPLADTRLTVESTGFSVLTDDNGQGMLYLSPGENSILLEKFGYYGKTEIVFAEAGEIVHMTTSLDEMPSFLVSGQIRAINGGLIPDAMVTFVGTPMSVVMADDFGHYSVSVPLGTDYVIRASGPGYSGLDKITDVQENSQVDFSLSALGAEGFETGDFSLLPWEHYIGSVSGSGYWWVDSAEQASGNFSATYGTDSFSQELTKLFCTVEVVEGTISFDTKISTSSSQANMTFRIDDNYVDSFSGEADWEHVSYPVSAGVHTFAWTFGSYFAATGYSWIDNVSFPFPEADPAARITLDSSALEVALEADATTSLPLQITNAGAVDLDFQMTGENMSWLNAQPSSGIVAAYDSLAVNLSFSAQGLEAGTYDGDLHINTNDPGNPETVIPITLLVTSGVSSVDDTPQLSLTLSAAPNPFNPMTRVFFSLPQDSAVELVIYDLAGRKIRSLLSDNLQSGSHEVLWRGVNDNDEAMASGTYLALLRTGSDRRTIKLVLTR